MEAREDDDPFGWDVARVVQELCTPNRSWNLPYVTKLPDPDQLSVRLAELEVDGETLLTYEEIVGSLKDFLTDLGIKKIPHQLSIRKVIAHFQARSARFQEFKATNSAEHSALDEKPQREQKVNTDVSSNGRGPTASLSPASPSVQLGIENRHDLSPVPRPGPSYLVNGHASEDTPMPLGAQGGSSTTSDRIHPSPGDHQDQPPMKKPRMAPTVVSTVPSGAFNFMPTEADFLTKAKPSIDPRHLNSSSFSYFSSRGYTAEDMRNPDLSGNETDSDYYFSFVKTGSDHPGRRIQVNRVMKKLLLHKSTPEPSNADSDPDGYGASVLGLLGESDYETDAETRKQMEEEEAELKKLEAAQKTFLSKDEIDDVIQEEIVSYEDRWNREKKPKEGLKANKLWNDARRYRDRHPRISKAMGLCRSLDARIEKIVSKLRKEQWRNREELRKQMASIERSIYQRQAERFRLRVLRSSAEPPKPRKLPRPPRRKKSQVRQENGDEDLTSGDSDDGLSQFVIDVEPDQIAAEVLDPFILEDISFDSLFQPGQKAHDAQLPGGRIDGPAAIDVPMAQQDRVPGGVTDGNHSPPPADDPMDIDQGPEVESDGDRFPPLVLDRAASPPSDGVSVHSTQDEVQTPVRKAADPKLTPTQSFDTPRRSKRPTESSALPAASPDNFSTPVRRNAEDVSGTSEISRRPDAREITSIAKLGVVYWAGQSRTGLSRTRVGLLISLLWKLPGDLRESLDVAVNTSGGDEAVSFWETRVTSLRNEADTGSQNEASDIGAKVVICLVQLYISWIENSAFAYPFRMSLDPGDFELLEKLHKKQLFTRFYRQLRRVLPGFRDLAPSGYQDTEGEASGQNGTPHTSVPLEDDDMDEAHETDDPEDMPISPSMKSEVSRKHKRKKRLIRNTEAADMRETNFEQKALFEGRRRKLREELADVLPKDMARFIINETKEDDEELIYINSRTRPNIKDHQVEGVRFMWNQIVVKSKVRQGCLLAHTMGLGKTMQVITLLVAIAKASSSQDEAVYKQIPKELRGSSTLILCPAGLVDNWTDELNIWTPLEGPEGQPLADNEVGFLGRVYKIPKTLKKGQRHACVLAWQATGGVLVLGYPMFLKLSKDPQLFDILLETPKIVIADEAHKLKGKDSQIHHATQNFRAASRIAMTGSPLTNNVADYYQMVSWVAPNYLGPYQEFKQVYEAPVDGLHSDSTPADKRRAVKTLNVLRETVSPLVHRMGILSLKDDLPQKKEFILYLGLTPLQLAAYSAYLQRIVYNSEQRERLGKGMTCIWTFVEDLAVLLAHPSIYQKRLKKPQAERKALPPISGDVTPALSPDEEAEIGAFDTSGVNSISEDVKSELLATVSNRDLQNLSHSWKVVILNAILDECKKIGDKVLVFSQHIATLEFLEEAFRREKRNWYRLDGKTNPTERQREVKRFNDDGKAEVYLISTKAGGEGLNIHGANRVVIFDFKYSPMEEQQAVGRAYRIGQTKPVFVYWLVVSDTFEESVQNRSVFKMQLASRVVDKKNPLSWAKRAVDLFPKDGRMPSIPLRAADIPAYSGKDVVLDTLLDSPKTGDSIRRIIMTETFEEEEPDDSILTTDDRKEISELVAKNHQRGAIAWAAGSRYAEDLQKSIFGQPIFSAPAHVSSGQAPSGIPEHMRTRQPQNMPAPNPPSKEFYIVTKAGMVPSADVPPGPVPAHNPASSDFLLMRSSGIVSSTARHFQPPQSTPNDFLSAPALNAASPFPMPNGRAATPSSGGPPVSLAQQPGGTDDSSTAIPGPRLPTASQPPAQKRPRGRPPRANPAPIPGTGTEFAPSGVDKQASAGGQSQPSSYLDTSGLSKTMESRKRRVFEMLLQTQNALEGEVQAKAPTPEEFMTDLEAAINTETDGIVMLDFLQILVKFFGESSRFSTWTLFGLVSARELSDYKRVDVMNLVKRLDEMDEADFTQSLLRADEDTSHIHPNNGASSRLPADEVAPTGQGEGRDGSRNQRASTAASQQPRAVDRTPATRWADVERQVENPKKGPSTHKQTKKRQPHLPGWAQKAVANENVEGSKSPQDGPPMLSQRATGQLLWQRKSSKQQSTKPKRSAKPPGASIPPSVKPPPSQPQRSESRSSVPKAGDSADNAWVID